MYLKVHVLLSYIFLISVTIQMLSSMLIVVVVFSLSMSLIDEDNLA